MVRIDRVQSGVLAFIDREIMPALSGWEKVIVGGGICLAAGNLPAIISKYPVLDTIGIYDAENGAIDVDALYNAMLPYIGNDRFPVKIPMTGITIKFGRPELDALYRSIKEA